MCDTSVFLREIEPSCGIGLPPVRTRDCQGAIAAAAAAHGGSACLATPLFDRGPPIAPYVCVAATSPERLRQLCALAGYGAGPGAQDTGIGAGAGPGARDTGIGAGAGPGARDTGIGAGAGLGIAGLGLAGVGIAGLGLTGRLPTRYGRAFTSKVGTEKGKRRATEKSVEADLDRIYKGQVTGLENAHITESMAHEMYFSQQGSLSKERNRGTSRAAIMAAMQPVDRLRTSW